VKITQYAASSSSSFSSSSLPSSDTSMDSSIDALPPDLSSDFPLSSFLVDLNGQWTDALAPDDDDEFCNFILEAFLA
jgi:hypothetical protein